jgi:hypothetical protein
MRKAIDELRDVAARRLDLHRDRNRIAVVLDEVHDRQAFK